MDTNELKHYGVLGMKWGVRRYQNYDGSYTKKGLERLGKSKSAYEKADTDYKTKKKSGASKDTLRIARAERKGALKEYKKDYKRLKQDKLGDQGKALYRSGKTITGNASTLNNVWVASLIGSSLLEYGSKFVNDYNTKKLMNLGAATIAIGSSVARGILAGIYADQNKKLRAYYGHSSK